MADIKQEHSAGGVILENGCLLLIMMRNLKGEKVWTFPKGHIDPGETPETAAVREVAEETGWDCVITGELFTARYSFMRGNTPVEKDVRWFLMRREGGDGVPKTPDEIVDTKWCALEEADGLLAYASDLEILAILKKTA